MTGSEYILSTPRARQERAGKIRMFGGRYVNPLNIQRDEVLLTDIAHHLSMLCRYTGACPFHYSVAQHSVIVARRAMLCHPGDLLIARVALMHDAAEAYLNDLASPVKHSAVLSGYRAAEERATSVIFDYFRLPIELLPVVKEHDNFAFRQEVDSFWGHADVRIPEILPRIAEANFLSLAAELGIV